MIYSILGYLTYFQFNHGVHQNHLFIVVLLLFILVAKDKSFYKAAIFWAVLFNVNLVIFYGIGGNGISEYVTWKGNNILAVVFSVISFFGYMVFFINKINNKPQPLSDER